MSRRAINGPNPEAFRTNSPINGSAVQRLVRDLDTLQNRYHRPISLFPVPDNYTQIGVQVEDGLVNAAYDWQPIGVWFFDEEVSKVDIALECHLLVMSLSAGTDTTEQWAFQWILSDEDGSRTDDTVTNVIREVRVYQETEARVATGVSPSVIEGRILPGEVPAMNLLEFRGDDIADVTTGVFPHTLSLQARGANDPNQLSYHQRLYVYSVLLTGEAI
jgi:hypothetical protein